MSKKEKKVKSPKEKKVKDPKVSVPVTANMKSLVALLLVTCLTIGLVASGALKVVASTYYLKNNKKLQTNNAAVNGIINAVAGDVNQQSNNGNNNFNNNPAATQPTTQSPAETTTQKPADTTKAPAETTTSAETTTQPNDEPTTSSSENTTSAATTTEPETDSPETIKEKTSVLKKYKTLINSNKANLTLTCNKSTYRSVDRDFIKGTLFLNLEKSNPDYFISEEAAKSNPTLITKDNIKSEFCINNSLGCILENSRASEAIKSVSLEKVEGGAGNKITIVLRDEENPKVLDEGAKKSESFTSAFFPVISSEDFTAMAKKGWSITDLSGAKLTYKECTVEVVYNDLGMITSLKQTVKYDATISGMLIKDSKCTVTEVTEYDSFAYLGVEV
ncbi:MAG: hypothetical protein ACI4IF_03185 [Acutalibacteraceae bacterium]